MYMSNDKFEELKKDFLYQLVNQPPQLNSVTVITIVPDGRENDFIDYAKRVADRLNTSVSFVPKRYQSGECVIETEFDWRKEDKFDKELKKQEELSLINNIVEQAIYHGGDIGGPYFSNRDGLCEAMEKYLVYKGFDKDTEVFYHTKGKDHNFVEFIKKEKVERKMSSIYSSLDKEDVERLKKGIIDGLEEIIKTAVDTDTPYRAIFVIRNDWVGCVKERIENEFLKYDKEMVYSLKVFDKFSSEYYSYEIIISPREKYHQTYTSSSIAEEKEQLEKELEEANAEG